MPQLYVVNFLMFIYKFYLPVSLLPIVAFDFMSDINESTRVLFSFGLIYRTDPVNKGGGREMVWEDIAKVLSSAQGALTAIAALLTIVAGFLPHFNWKLTDRLQKEASRLNEIDKTNPYHDPVSGQNNTAAKVKDAIPAREMAYTVVRNHISEKICWLLFASETNDLQTQRRNWGMGFPPPYIALAAAVFAILPAAGLATMAQDPNNTKVMIITYVFMFGWLAIVLLFSAADWWALRKDIFKDKLHPLFTGFENKSNDEVEKVMKETVTDFSKRYGDHSLALITLFSWLCTIFFWDNDGYLFLYRVTNLSFLRCGICNYFGCSFCSLFEKDER